MRGIDKFPVVHTADLSVYKVASKGVTENITNSLCEDIHMQTQNAC